MNYANASEDVLSANPVVLGLGQALVNELQAISASKKSRNQRGRLESDLRAPK